MDIRMSYDQGRLILSLTTLPLDCHTLEIRLPGGQRLTHEMSRQAGDLNPPDLLAEFLIYLEINENRKPNTLTGYRNRCGQFLEWLIRAGWYIDEPDAWPAYWADLKRRDYSPYTLRGHYRVLHRFGRWLYENGHLPAQPLADVLCPPVPKNKPPKAITQDHIERMLAVAEDARDKAILMFFRDTACRAHEAVALKWRDVHLSEGKASVIGKGDKARFLFFKPATRQALEIYRRSLDGRAGPNEAVWQGHQGPLTYQGLYMLFKRIAHRAGIEDSAFSPHAWRHAFGRDATINGMPTAQLQDVLGHSRMETTKIYAQFDTDELQQAHNRYSPVK